MAAVEAISNKMKVVSSKFCMKMTVKLEANVPSLTNSSWPTIFISALRAFWPKSQFLYQMSIVGLKRTFPRFKFPVFFQSLEFVNESFHVHKCANCFIINNKKAK